MTGYIHERQKHILRPNCDGDGDVDVAFGSGETSGTRALSDLLRYYTGGPGQDRTHIFSIKARWFQQNTYQIQVGGHGPLASLLRILDDVMGGPGIVGRDPSLSLGPSHSTHFHEHVYVYTQALGVASWFSRYGPGP